MKPRPFYHCHSSTGCCQLQTSRIPFPQEVLAEGNRRMARMMQLMSLSPPLQEDDSTLPQERVSVFQDDSQFMLHVATAICDSQSHDASTNRRVSDADTMDCQSNAASRSQTV
ncbi:hypothetical protein BASA62_008373 [Batrachochytrium salamandrivorans]|nr:hypothetical protein BASA62_008373 [Batrachochytrium salamandrivorans]